MRFSIRLLYLAVTLISFDCLAQVELAKSEFGFAIGDNFSWYTGTKSNMTVGLGLGIYSRIKIAKRLTVDPRMYFTNMVGSGGLTVGTPSQYPKTAFDTTNVRRSVFYFTFIAPVSYHLSQRLSIGLGPQFMILQGGTNQFKSTIGNDALIADAKKSLHQFDAGIAASLTYSRTIQVGLIYYYGLMYVVKDDAIQAKNSSVQLFVGIPLRKIRRKSTAEAAN